MFSMVDGIELSNGIIGKLGGGVPLTLSSGIEIELSSKISGGGWSGFGMETVGIHPNNFGVLNGHPNKIGGGVPLTLSSGVSVGSIGISGAMTAGEDEVIALAAAAEIEGLMEKAAAYKVTQHKAIFLC